VTRREPGFNAAELNGLDREQDDRDHQVPAEQRHAQLDPGRPFLP
jgi:hypothetical protein